MLDIWQSRNFPDEKVPIDEHGATDVAKGMEMTTSKRLRYSRSTRRTEVSRVGDRFSSRGTLLVHWLFIACLMPFSHEVILLDRTSASSEVYALMLSARKGNLGAL